MLEITLFKDYFMLRQGVDTPKDIDARMLVTSQTQFEIKFTEDIPKQVASLEEKLSLESTADGASNIL